MEENLFLENYQALLACILNEDLTIDKSLKMMIYHDKKYYYANKKHRKVETRTDGITVHDIKDKKEMIFRNRKELHNFFKNKEDYNKGALDGAMYKNSLYRKRYKLCRY